jgi:hypothetical protein
LDEADTIAYSVDEARDGFGLSAAALDERVE